MNIHEIYGAWKNSGFLNQSAFVFTFLGFVFGVLSVAGVHMELISLSFFLLICAILLFAKGNINQSAELIKTKEKLRQAAERASQDIQSVYAQKNEEIRRLDLNLATQKDQSANWKNKAALTAAEVVQWKEDCRMLFEIRNELKLEIQHLDEELRRVYELHPSSDPRRQTSYSMDVILSPSTPQDARLMDIVRRLHRREYKLQL
jgi:hypothetical protein